jgi:hypothetical protein
MASLSALTFASIFFNYREDIFIYFKPFSSLVILLRSGSFSVTYLYSSNLGVKVSKGDSYDDDCSSYNSSLIIRSLKLFSFAEFAVLKLDFSSSITSGIVGVVNFFNEPYFLGECLSKC